MAKKSDVLGVSLPKLPSIKDMPGLPRKPRGPRALRGLTAAPTVLESNQPPEKPATFQGTLPEWRVYWWLQKHGYEFDFQSSLLGGRIELGGQVADFLLPNELPPMIIRVQGLAWHYGFRGDIPKDQKAKDILEGMGYRVIDVDEDDVNERLDYVMVRAMRGEDISRAMWSR